MGLAEGEVSGRLFPEDRRTDEETEKRKKQTRRKEAK
jgi:hypothetical protein